MENSKEKKKREPVYDVKGIPIHAYLIETGEFRWIPTSEACGNRENANKILKVLRKMPEDRRSVWVSRLDAEQTKKMCPVIHEEADLCKEFDELYAAYSKPKLKRTNRAKGGDLSDEKA